MTSRNPGISQSRPNDVNSQQIARPGLRKVPILVSYALPFDSGEHPVDPKLVFVMSAFRQETEAAFEAIQAAANHHGLQARRVKDEVEDYRIANKIIEMIQCARFLVADLTYERPNVYFELGFARGLGKTVVTTVRKGTQIHFDVKDWTYLEYGDSRELERDLIARLSSELERDSQRGP